MLRRYFRSTLNGQPLHAAVGPPFWGQPAHALLPVCDADQGAVALTVVPCACSLFSGSRHLLQHDVWMFGGYNGLKRFNDTYSLALRWVSVASGVRGRRQCWNLRLESKLYSQPSGTRAHRGNIWRAIKSNSVSAGKASGSASRQNPRTHVAFACAMGMVVCTALIQRDSAAVDSVPPLRGLA